MDYDGLPRLHIYSFREHVTARLQDQFILAAWSQGAIFLKSSSSLTCITGAVELFQKGEKASNPKQSILTSNLILYNLIKSYHSPRDRKQHKSLRQPPCCSRYFSDTLWALEVINFRGGTFSLEQAFQCIFLCPQFFCTLQASFHGVWARGGSR